MNNKDYFPDLVGQHAVKKKLGFYLEAFNKTEMCPFLNLIGAKGLGKTEFAKAFARNLRNKDGDKRSFLELNCSTIKNNEQFFEQIFMPLVSDNEITILFDECHALPLDLTMAFLTIFNTEKNSRKNFEWNEATFEFNFKKQTFIFATTESDKMFPPLKDRLTVVEFSDYSVDDLKGIIKSYLSEYTFCEDALQVIAETSRGNARSCILMAQDIRNYCKTYRIEHVSKNDAMQLFTILGILPEGLNRIEWQILNILKKHGSCSLASLAAKTGLSRSSIQRDHEMFLLRKGFITIEGLRKITYHGVKVIDKKFN